MPRLPQFLRRARVDRLGGKRIEMEIERFIEDLNFWFDKVFLYQKDKKGPEADRFMRKLSERVQSELECISNDRGFECEKRKAG